MSMWEPRSSHLYVWTGLRVCEWFCVGVGTPCHCPCCGQSGTGCARPCVPWCVRVYSLHMVCGYAPLSLSTPACVRVCKVCDLVCCSLFRVACEWACVGVCVLFMEAVVYSHVWASVRVCVGTRACPRNSL